MCVRNITEYIKHALGSSGMIHVRTFCVFVCVDDFAVWFLLCVLKVQGGGGGCSTWEWLCSWNFNGLKPSQDII